MLFFLSFSSVVLTKIIFTLSTGTDQNGCGSRHQFHSVPLALCYFFFLYLLPMYVFSLSSINPACRASSCFPSFFRLFRCLTSYSPHYLSSSSSFWAFSTPPLILSSLFFFFYFSVFCFASLRPHTSSPFEE